MPKLVKRLGEFTEGDYPKDRPLLKPEPVTEAETMFKDEWQEYQQEKAAEKRKRALLLNRKKNALQRWAEERKARREALLRTLSPHGLSMMNIGRYFLKEQQQREKGKLHHTQKAIPERRTSIHTFKHWFSQKASKKAVLWRLRKKLTPNLRVERFTFPKIFDCRPYYEQYLETEKKELGENADGSRIDAEIALQMRLDGHDINASISTIYHESEWAKLRTSREDRLEYVKCIARVSFGVVGDVAIAQRKAEEMRKREVTRQTDNEFFPYSTEDNQLLAPLYEQRVPELPLSIRTRKFRDFFLKQSHGD